MPKNVKMKKLFLQSSARPALAVCAVLATATLPALAAPTQPATPPTTGRTSAMSTPAATSTTTKPTPSIAVNNVTVAAEVGDEKIMAEDINRMMADIVMSTPALGVDTPEAKEQLKKMRDDLLDNMIAQRLMYQEAVRRDKAQTDKTKLLLPTDQQVADAVWNFQKSFSSEVGFNNWLKDEHKTVEDLKTLFRRRIAIENLKSVLISEVTVTDADLKTYYEAHKTEMVVPETVTARHIQISFPTERDKDGNMVVKTMSADEKKKLQQKALGILNKAKSEGTDFAVLAQQNSDDPDSKSNGGDLGTLIRGDVLDDAFAEALFSATPGKVYPKLVETKVGFHIIKVDDKKPGRPLSLTEVSPTIKPRILAEKAKNKVDQQIAQLRATTKVRKYI